MKKANKINRILLEALENLLFALDADILTDAPEMRPALENLAFEKKKATKAVQYAKDSGVMS